MLQSTSLLRGKTITRTIIFTYHMLQSTSLLRGKTSPRKSSPRSSRASIHFPLAREDPKECIREKEPEVLQSTSLLRGKTQMDRTASGRNIRFNPLPSCEGRRLREGRYGVLECFNPLPSCEGRHFFIPPLKIYWIASIHFPLAREDCHSAASFQ